MKLTKEQIEFWKDNLLSLNSGVPKCISKDSNTCHIMCYIPNARVERHLLMCHYNNIPERIEFINKLLEKDKLNTTGLNITLY